jgi:hypothetical protein
MRHQLTILAAAALFLATTAMSPGDVTAGATDDLTGAPPMAAPEAVKMVVGPSPMDREAVAEIIDAAVARLDPQVAFRSHPESLRYAVRAYHNFRAAYPEEVRKPYLYFVDYGLDSRTPRGYVLDMENSRVVEGPFTVAHGRGSVAGGGDLPTRFLNLKDSNATSLGLYLAEETYRFSGKAGGRSYHSLGLRLRGVSGRFNDAARERGIVVHGAPYVGPRAAGRSEGCPAVELPLAEELIPRIANGGLVFHFSPLDRRWLREDPWAGVITPGVVGLF